MQPLFLSAGSAQSRSTLTTLLQAGIRPIAVLTDAPAMSDGSSILSLAIITAVDETGIEALAAQHGIPSYRCPVNRLFEKLKALKPSQVIVSCYPHRITENLLALIPGGWINIHPSLLPRYRGPNPIFWQLRDGLPEMGVTLHFMNEQLDQGPVLAQTAFKPLMDASFKQISAQAGAVGAKLYLDWTQQTDATPAHPQMGSSSHQGHPQTIDLIIDPAWSAEHLIRFIKGCRDIATPTLRGPSGQLEAIADVQMRRKASQKNHLLLECKDGTVELTMQTSRPTDDI